MTVFTTEPSVVMGDSNSIPSRESIRIDFAINTVQTTDTKTNTRNRKMDIKTEPEKIKTEQELKRIEMASKLFPIGLYILR